MSKTRRLCLSSTALAGAAGLFAGGAALAQSDGLSAVDEARDEIIVTTERREQNIQDVAGAVQTFSADDLRRDGVGSEIRNLSFAVPGLNISNQEGNVEIFIRGVGSANNTELGDPATAPHINGVYIPRPRGLGVQFYDVERVEVNKGPQGTLRGRNAVAGTLNIITKRPNLDEVEGYVQGEIGAYKQRSFEGALSVPLADWAAVRVAGFSENHDSYFDNAGPDQNLEAAGKEDELALRGSLLMEPTDRLSVFVVADYVEEGGTGYPGANLFDAFQAGDSFEDLDPRAVVYRGAQGMLDSKQWGLALQASYDFGPFILEYTGSRRVLDFYQVNAASDGVASPGRDVSAGAIDTDNFSTVYWEQRSWSNVHEVRLSAPDESRFRWTVGGFYLDETQDTGFFSLNDKGVFFSGVEFTMPDVDINSKAVFADGVFDVTENFRVKAGIRYTDEEKYRFGVGGNWTLGLGSEDFNCCFTTRLGTPGFKPAMTSRPSYIAPTNNAEAALFLADGAIQFGSRDTLVQQLAGIADGTSPNGTCIDNDDTDPAGNQTCPANGQYSFLTVGAPAQQLGEFQDDFIDWRAGFEYDFTPDNMLYFTVSTGTKSGGFNDNLTVDVAPAFGTERLLAYELGLKNVFEVNGRRMVLNASGFYYDYQDQVFQSLVQVGGPSDEDDETGLALLNENAADSRILGVEVFGSMELPAGFTFDSTLLWLDAKVREGELADVRGQDYDLTTTVENIDLSDNRLPLTSDINLIFRLQQARPMFGGEADWQVLANYRSDYYLSVFNEDDIVRPEGSAICGSNDALVCGFESQQAGYWTVNLGAGYTSGDGRWRVEAYGTNLLNVDASQKALLGNNLNLRFLNLPRTGGVRLRVNI